MLVLQPIGSLENVVVSAGNQMVTVNDTALTAPWEQNYYQLVYTLCPLLSRTWPYGAACETEVGLWSHAKKKCDA
ncbi:hypothetical protein NQ317_004464 [Molorchus minor]|uniref:Uncharacterized protein n=1 Tax=Molorchus minor TaxID=1323400 RepID=A0ABQ9JLJ2_9CUCU|nr:hypothetical protein NQ317_004464 [Molorchus minor]